MTGGTETTTISADDLPVGHPRSAQTVADEDHALTPHHGECGPHGRRMHMQSVTDDLARHPRTVRRRTDNAGLAVGHLRHRVTLLKAMRYSHFADRIQLVLAGKGPTEMTLKRAADKLLVLKDIPVDQDCAVNTVDSNDVVSHI